MSVFVGEYTHGLHAAPQPFRLDDVIIDLDLDERVGVTGVIGRVDAIMAVPVVLGGIKIPAM